MRLEKKLDILGPIRQAGRCLEVWLKEEGRDLPAKQRQRAAALMARYFHHEEDVTDQLMLSFLRHYSNQNQIDMEDPTSVRMEIKAVLDKSSISMPQNKNRTFTAFIVGVFITSLSLGLWGYTHKKITKDQQAELKSLVHQLVERDKSATSAGIWVEMKQPLQVRSYQDMTWWNYRRSMEILQERLSKLPVTPAPADGSFYKSP